jgi:hypothetical protein
VDLGVDLNLGAKPGAASRHPDEIRHTSGDLTKEALEIIAIAGTAVRSNIGAVTTTVS